jgi:hypothetical protein
LAFFLIFCCKNAFSTFSYMITRSSLWSADSRFCDISRDSVEVRWLRFSSILDRLISRIF